MADNYIEVGALRLDHRLMNEIAQRMNAPMMTTNGARSRAAQQLDRAIAEVVRAAEINGNVHGDLLRERDEARAKLDSEVRFTNELHVETEALRADIDRLRKLMDAVTYARRSHEEWLGTTPASLADEDLKPWNDECEARCQAVDDALDALDRASASTHKKQDAA